MNSETPAPRPEPARFLRPGAPAQAPGRNHRLGGGRPRATALAAAIAALAAITCGTAEAAAPAITSVMVQNGTLVVSASVPAGYRHAVIESGATVVEAARESVIAGALNGAPATVTFILPNPGATRFLRVRFGTSETLPPATLSGPQYFAVDYNVPGTEPLTPVERSGHLLNRLAYGPTATDFQTVQTLGAAAFIEQQLNPAGIDETSNTALSTREAALFTVTQPSEDTFWINSGDTWRYLKGTQAPPTAWKTLGYSDSAWLEGRTGIGYGDDDDATELEDMRQAAGNAGYLTVYLRKSFTVSDPAALDQLILSVDFDDGFVAYLNGTEIARENVTGANPLFSDAASNDHEAGEPEEYDVTARKALLVPGENVLAIELHNASRSSSDASMIPRLIARRLLPIPPQRRIADIEALQQLAHIRGIYSRRQLQAVLGEFWENHFTTDFDKVAEHFADLRNSDSRMAMTEAQAAREAAHAEYTEYQFFHDHALGNFGDLLLYSATSPAQLIYLDNVLNLKGAPNENYAREILELFAFGVDNRYTQTDIEQLAKCFTGWTVRKVWPDQQPTFPASARTPPIDESVQYEDRVVFDLGAGWRYFKGTREPSPAGNGTATTAWTQPDFNAVSWTAGATGMGYGDNDDATTLPDMRNGYLSVYLRREFATPSAEFLEGLLLSVDYDDGFVAYLNGTEIARSETMEGTGTPPPFNRAASGSHEAGRRPDNFSLREFAHLLKPAPALNVLAIQMHNISADSSDASILPRLVSRRTLPGSIENGDPNGLWTFRFNPAQHDLTEKVLFRGTSYEFKVPAGRTGTNGLRDAIDVIDYMVGHPSTAEFICIKLINKFVSDEISLHSYHEGTAPADLTALLDDARRAWNSTQPAGHIATVLRAILKPGSLDGPFWARANHRAKVKTPIEFINSSARALGVNVGGTSLPAANDTLGMHLFTRDDPDGWSESGIDWIDTGTLLARMQFAQTLSSDRVGSVRWDLTAWLAANQLSSAASIVDYFNQLLFQGSMPAANRELLIRFATTDDAGNPLPLDPGRTDYAARVRDLVGFILGTPQWHFQ